ncbi:hypothetical protein IE53DRAFT_146050 [Violaceomyces palustris]|uniref:Uncharacterized protein n=1 Tax=Violaceomyces palustris TaxID=1673888 RepID=A0ACD0NUE1_9BASI|nr:hypothetical protein IE53DRAFT_146050 [Violaceomyces palustris]
MFLSLETAWPCRQPRPPSEALLGPFRESRAEEKMGMVQVSSHSSLIQQGEAIIHEIQPTRRSFASPHLSSESKRSGRGVLGSQADLGTHEVPLYSLFSPSPPLPLTLFSSFHSTPGKIGIRLVEENHRGGLERLGHPHPFQPSPNVCSSL